MKFYYIFAQGELLNKCINKSKKTERGRLEGLRKFVKIIKESINIMYKKERWRKES